AQRDPAVGRELDREARRRPDRDDDRAAGDGSLLDELERESAADADDAVRERQTPLAVRPADDLVERVVATDILPQAEQAAGRVEQPGCVQPACGGEGGLRGSQAVGER